MLGSLGLQSAQAAAVMALPMPGGCPYNHVAYDGRLVGFPQASCRQAACNGTSRLHIDAGRLVQALPPLRNPSKVTGLEAPVQAAVGRVLPSPLGPFGHKGSFQAHFLQQTPEAEQGTVCNGAFPDLGKDCIAPLPSDQGAALPTPSVGRP